MELGQVIQHADWKKEKHVPVIEAPDSVMADQMFTVSVTIGKEIAHPNTTEHHIRWITLYFQPEKTPSTYDVAHFEFNAHGEAVAGANQGPVYTHSGATAQIKIKEAGTLIAVSFCNIHGLWEDSKPIALK